MRKTNLDEELDGMLAHWDERQALSPVRAEAIRRAARATAQERARESGPGRDWWQHLFRGVSHAMRFSTDPRRYLPPAFPGALQGLDSTPS